VYKIFGVTSTKCLKDTHNFLLGLHDVVTLVEEYGQDYYFYVVTIYVSK